MTRFFVALATVFAALFGFNMSAHAQYGPGGSGSATISPPSVVPGGSITVNVSNCQPGEIVEVSVAGVSVQVTCDEFGVASASLSMPVVPGSYTGTAVGSVSASDTQFVATVLQPVTPPGGLPATGSGGIDSTIGAAAGLLAMGFGLVGVTLFRRRHATAA
jgi:hypothetical protein